ncbi:MAG: SLC13 family permease [Lentisphaeria bacterium]
MITYFIISGWKLQVVKIDRPAGVLLGTVLMVAAGIITPKVVPSLVNWDTIILLFGMMVIIEHLSESNIFATMVARVDALQLNAQKLLFISVMGLGILAAFLVNDIVCIIFAPILVLMIKSRSLPVLPFVMALATATNIGGVIAYTGTPQNMIIGSMSGISYWRYFVLMLPIGLVCLFINYFLLCKIYKTELSKELKTDKISLEVGETPMAKRSLMVLVLVVIGFFIYKEIAWVALAGAVLLLILAGRDEYGILQRIDWSLLLFFMGLFIVVGGLSQSGAIDLFIEEINPYLKDDITSMWLLGFCTLIGSNLFANVPYVLVVGEAIKSGVNSDSMWITLAFSSTIAGNLTLIGAVANVIVVQRVKKIREISFLDFLKFGLPSAIVCFMVGMIFLTCYVKFKII